MATFGAVASSLHRPALVSWCMTESPSTSADRSHDQISVGPWSPQSSCEEEEEEEEEDRGHARRIGKTRPLEDMEEMFVLPRSSPVISRHRRRIQHKSCLPSSVDVDSSSLSLDQCGRQSNISAEDVRHRDTSCPRSSLNHFLNSLFHMPFTGQQGLAEDQRGRRPVSCGAPPTTTGTGHSTQRCSSGFPEFSAEIFKTSCELEKEIAHLVVVDILLDVLESVKFTLSLEQQTTNTHTPENTCEHTHVHENTHQHIHEATNGRHHPNTSSVLSTDSGFEDGGEVVTLMPPDSLRSAEWLAQQLVLDFKKRWLPSHEPRHGRQSLRSSLQQLPGTGSVTTSVGGLTEEIILRSRMRGKLSWTPPRFQIIFTVQPTLRRSDVVASQHFLCAGCGMEVEPRYMKRLRYCEYMGRYFCQCCHSGSEAVIPARVLSCWDFNRYPVSDFSKQLLDSVWYQPLFELTCVAEMLGSRGKELDKFRELLDQLLDVRKLLKTCRFSGRVTPEFTQIPAHLLSERPLLVSMDDLLRLRRGQLLTQARAVLDSAVSHVENCQLCLARGFICEFCRGGGVIFSFQSDTCSRCPVCKTCFHKECVKEKSCPKCVRVQSRRKLTEESANCEN